MDELSLLKRAVLEIREMRSRIDTLERAKIEPIAVIGLGCRFPDGAESPDEFWRMLRDGVDGITEVPSDRWNVDAYYDPEPGSPGKTYTRCGGFLKGVDSFDAQFFRISPREAASMDPQQRLLLEVSWEALEHAGQAPGALTGTRTGVFVGITTNDYMHLQIEHGDTARLDAYAATGNPLNFGPGRVSYVLGLQGPCMAVDAACASSLVTIHLACQSLRARECQLALAGGVNLILSPQGAVLLSQTRALSPDGRCKTFDRSADGMSRGEGCGIIVLKRLSDALRDQDHILALIRGSAISQDGASSGLTVPNALAQQSLIREALRQAGVKPSEVSYVEAHGTGTALGDPIEVRSLAAVFGEGRQPDQPLMIGSVKTNIGHLEAAAGVAGVIKTVLALGRREIPPHLHLSVPTPHVAWEEIPVTVPTELTAWRPVNERRIAGVSAFGLSGIISHLVLEEAPAQVHLGPAIERPVQVLTVSARSEQALHELAGRIERRLRDESPATFPDICFTANTGRSHFEHRAAIIADAPGKARDLLSAFARGESQANLFCSRHESSTAPKVAFLFTGQGSQYVGMGRHLFETQPSFRRSLERCDELLRPMLQRPLLSVLYPQTGEASPIDQTAYTQPVLFAFEFALAQLWRSWGIEPDIVVGHSVGEYVAACLAGVFTLEEGLKLIAERGRLMQGLSPQGAMVAVLADEESVLQAIAPFAEHVSIAAVNSPENTVISGDERALEEIVRKLESQRVKTQRLTVSHAFHSPLMTPMLRTFEETAAQVKYSLPRISWVSALTGRRVGGSQASGPDYWVRHVRETVRFSASLQTLRDEGCNTFIEIGPKPVLLQLARRCLGDNAGLWLASLRQDRNAWQQMLESLAHLYVRGRDVDWAGFDRDYGRHRVSLPTYPFQRKRYWFKTAEEEQPVTAVVGRDARTGADPQLPAWLYSIEWRRKNRSEEAPTAGFPTEVRRKGNWLIFADREGVGAALAALLERRGHEWVLVSPGKTYESTEDGNYQLDPAKREHFDRLLQDMRASTDLPWFGVVHLWNLNASFSNEPSASAIGDALIEGSRSALYLAQAVASVGGSESPRLWLVTRGVQPAETASFAPAALAQAATWGLGRVIALEHPALWGGLVDLDTVHTQDETAELLKEIENPDGEDQIAFRPGGRHVGRLAPVDLREASKGNFTPRTDGTYLITGGCGGLGLIVSDWMVRQGAKHLVLMSRGGPSKAAGEVVAALERAGAKVMVAAGDVSREEDVTRVLEEIAESGVPLRGIVHAAGVLEDGVLLRQDWKRFEAVLTPKVAGAWNLHALTQHLPLDFFVLFSSAASIVGSPGQGNYAAANAFLDALSHYRHARGLPALSINWGPWADTGMAARTAADRSALRHGSHPAIGSIAPRQGVRFLQEILRTDRAQIAVLPVDQERVLHNFPSGSMPPLFSELGLEERPAVNGVEDTTESHALVQQILACPPAQRVELTESHLRRLLAAILAMDEQDLPVNRSLLELGIDSLMVMELLKQVKRTLGLALYPREVYERPTIEALATYIVSDLQRAYPEEGDRSPGELARPEAFPLWRQSGATPGRRSAAIVERNPGIVFLLSSPRSGSTLLRVMLAGHPALFCPPELHLLPFENMAERRDALVRSYLDEGLQRALMELKALSAEESKFLVNDFADRRLPTQEIYRLLQDLASPRQLVDKSPTYAGSLETLNHAEHLFADARYVHLVRHPYEVIESFVRHRMDRLMGFDGADPHALAEQIWTTTNRNVIDFFVRLDPARHHQVRYHELVRDPATVMKRLCDFLRVDFDEALLKPYEGKRMTDGVHPQSLAIGDPTFLEHKGIDASLSEAWRHINLPRCLGGPARDVAGRLLFQLPAEEHAPIVPVTSLASPGAVAMRERQVDVRGLRFSLCCWGPEDGPVVLLLHGILEDGASWEDVAVPLSEKGFRVLAPDQRGHGLSGHVGIGGSYHLLDFVADLDAMARELSNQPFTLVGHSMGAAVAAMYGCARPGRIGALVLVECPVPDGRKDRDVQEQLGVHLDYLATPCHHQIFPDVADAARRLRQATPSMSELQALRIARRLTEPCDGGMRWRWDPRIRTRAGIAFHGTDSLSASQFLDLLGRIRAPLTLVSGKSSDFLRSDQRSQLRAALPHATHVELPGAHHLHFDAPVPLSEVIAGAAHSRQHPEALYSQGVDGAVRV